MKKRGRKHSPGEKLLMAKVSEVFRRKQEELGAKVAAKQLNISLASFYNYAAGTDLPRMEVLRDAQREWEIKWELIDPSEIVKTRRLQSAEQLAFRFIEAVREEDVQIVRIGPKKQNILQVTFNIRFSA